MKLHGEWAGGSNPVQAGLVAVRSLGGWGEVDGVAEGLQLADQPAFGGVGVVVAGEPVSAKIAVAGTVVEDEPDDHQQVVGDRDGGLAAALLAEPAVQPAEAGTQVGAGPASGPGRLDQRLADLTVARAGLGAVVLAGRLACARVQTSQEARWSAVAKRDMSTPISPMSTWAVRSAIPGSCAAGPPARRTGRPAGRSRRPAVRSSRSGGRCAPGASVPAARDGRRTAPHAPSPGRGASCAPPHGPARPAPAGHAPRQPAPPPSPAPSAW